MEFLLFFVRSPFAVEIHTAWADTSNSNRGKQHEYHPQLSEMDMEELSKRRFAANSERK